MNIDILRNYIRNCLIENDLLGDEPKDESIENEPVDEMSTAGGSISGFVAPPRKSRNFQKK